MSSVSTATSLKLWTNLFKKLLILCKFNIIITKILLVIPTDQQHAVNEGATAVDSAGSSQDPTLQVSPEKPSSLVTDLKPGVPPNTCITCGGKGYHHVILRLFAIDLHLTTFICKCQTEKTFLFF